jgi:hypothetical protein
MKVQYYSVPLPDNNRNDPEPGSPVIGDDAMVTGFIQKVDYDKELVEIILFKPELLDFDVIEQFPMPGHWADILKETLKLAPAHIQEFWETLAQDNIAETDEPSTVH